jgi:hypothetical protein
MYTVDTGPPWFGEPECPVQLDRRTAEQALTE